MSDDFAVVREALPQKYREPGVYAHPSQHALDRIEARLAAAEAEVARCNELLDGYGDWMKAKAERDEARAELERARAALADSLEQLAVYRDNPGYTHDSVVDALRADAEQLADALRSIVSVAAFHLAEYENSRSGAGPVSPPVGAVSSTPAPDADPDADYLHGIGMKC